MQERVDKTKQNIDTGTPYEMYTVWLKKSYWPPESCPC